MSIDPFDIPGPNDFIESTFGQNGYLANKFHEYKIRPGQILLSKAVDESIVFGEHLLVEGPTATGKTVAYLVPASYHAATTDKRVVVVTANIALSEQLVFKDLPLLAEILPWEFTYSLLKGKNNFVCNRRYQERRDEGFVGFRGTDEETDQLEAVKDWIADGANGSGDMSELDFQPSTNVWREVSISADECDGQTCKQFDGCFAIEAQSRAREATIIITNYHLLCAHLSVRQKTGIDAVLPPFEIAVLDEVHKFASVARDFFGFRITRESVRRAANALGKHSINGLSVASKVANLFEHLASYKKSDSYQVRLKEKLIDNYCIGFVWTELSVAMHKCIKDYTEEMLDKKFELDGLLGILNERDTSVRKLKAEINKLTRATERLQELHDQCTEIFTLSNSATSVYFIDTDDRGFISLMSKPIHVGNVLNEQLFKKTNCVIGTSATMTTGGDDFGFIAAEIGITGYSTLAVKSPFDWPNQMTLVLPPMPDPQNRVEFPEAVADRLDEIITLSGGRCLALFTSYSNMKVAYERIQHRRNEFQILRQGDMPRTKLLERFKNDRTSVLLGTESFWAGVDVPGDSLSVVVIDRLPFPTPDDPIVDAIREANPRGWFHEYAVPLAIIALKQGFGRLIRSSSDRGVVVILDNRLTTKRYGRTFLNSLPPVSQSDDIEDVGRFLDARILTELSDEEFFARVFA